MIVVVPAHNEADHIEATVAGLLTAKAMLPAGLSCEVVVVADGCSDDTAALASSAEVTVIESAPRCVGLARRLGTEHALTRTDVTPDRVWLVNTDADTAVPRDWLRRHLAHARSGCRAVAGIVEIAASSDHPDLLDRFNQYYKLNSDGTHHHVHGANMGVRADAYLAAGGWNPLHTGEDHDLWNRIVPMGLTASDTLLRVHTSSRLEGRAPDGFARDLTRLAAAS